MKIELFIMLRSAQKQLAWNGGAGNSELFPRLWHFIQIDWSKDE